jgi:hypothetical protein
VRVSSLARILRGVQLLHIAGNTFTAAELVANGRQLVFDFLIRAQAVPTLIQKKNV